MFTTTTFFQVRNDALLLYDQPLERHGKRHQLPLPGKSTYSGKVTPHARKRLLKAMDILIQRSPMRKVYNPVLQKSHDFRIAFITLTIALEKNLQVKEAYDSLLVKWLRYMKGKQGMTDYVWKAEYQSRGQVHYHVATNSFIEQNVIRWKWNQLQRNAGYLKNYALRYGNFKPPSTHVKCRQDLEKIAEYISKEMCKNVQNQRTTKGKIWDCSLNLKRDRYSDFAYSEMYDLIDDALQHGFAEVVKTAHCTIVKTDNPVAMLTAKDQQLYHQYIQG